MLARSAVPGRHDLASMEYSGSWTFQRKIDGVRVILAHEDGRVTIRGRNGSDITASFPEVSSSVSSSSSFVLDGELELVGQSTLGDLLSRVGTDRDAARNALASPARVHAFDLLELNGSTLIRESLEVRSAALAALVGDVNSMSFVLVPSFPGGVVLSRFSRSSRQEGIMAKRLDSLYFPGRRMGTWIKFKNTYKILCVAYAHTPGVGHGALRLAVVDSDGDAVPVGSVGSGLRERDVAAVLAARAVRIYPVVEVSCLGISRNGRLREPTFITRRPDLDEDAADAAQLRDLPVST